MKLEAVIISVGYGDFLAHTLMLNRKHFARMVVVTDTADDRTRQICAFHHVQCISTDVFYKNDVAFNKGRGINEGLRALDLDGWVAHLDADIVLPPRTAGLLEVLPLDVGKIYGIDRMMCPSFEAWQNYVSNPEMMHSGEAYVRANRFPLGARLAWTNEVGWLPCGFTQIWNPTGSGVRAYPIAHGEAARADIHFAMQWPRQARELLPEIIAIHLESQAQPKMGINWRGRRTREFSLDGSREPEAKPGFVSDGYHQP